MKIVVNVKEKKQREIKEDKVKPNDNFKETIIKSKFDKLIDLLISKNIISEEDLTKLKG